MYSVLIVDDERIVRLGIRTILERSQTRFTQIYECADGAEAAGLLATVRPDLIITDIKMPNMGGLELVEQCHALFHGNMPEVLVLSGHRDFEYAQKAMRYGVKNYLLKPVARRDLLEAVQDCEQKLLARGKRLDLTPGPIEEQLKALWQGHQTEGVVFAALQVHGSAGPGSPQDIIEAFFDGQDRPVVVLHGSGPATWAMAGQFAGMFGAFDRHMRDVCRDGYSLGLSDGTHALASYSQAVRQARQALKIALLNPCHRLFACKPGVDYSDGSKLLQALEYIHEHFANDIGMAQVANHVSLNYTYFSGMLKSELGVNFTALIAELRVQKAKALLAMGGYKVSEVARLVGYQDPKRFTKVFQKICGMTPYEFKTNA